jgi:hypothetical protein
MEIINYVITAVFAALVGALTPILVARFSKTRRERELDLASGYIRLVDMTSDQLESKINQIGLLEKQLNILEDKIMLQRREIDGLNARIIAMQIDEQAKETRWLAKFDALEQYIKLLIDILRAHDIEIPPRPDILKESDPKIKRMK